MTVAVMLQAAGEQVLADNAGGVNPGLAMDVKVTESRLIPGQPFSAIVVIEMPLPVEAPGVATIVEEFDASANQGRVFPELLKAVPVWTVSLFGVMVPLVMVTQAPPVTLVFRQPDSKPIGIPPMGAVPITL